ncbi:hypothetical protein [Williamsia herbipolensis]|uniref:hypothetical protein n=1 Tax=Williamsia herbipolensis TaxID=1603258 RepID=UPI0005F836A1|nr:hypothetical protein [Williamsia herbipolensis]
MVSRGASDAQSNLTRAYDALSDKMYELEARSVRSDEALRTAMSSWDDLAEGEEPEPRSDSESAADNDRELKARLEEEMSLWHEENGWSATMPEQDRLDLVRSIRSDLDAMRRR